MGSGGHRLGVKLPFVAVSVLGVPHLQPEASLPLAGLIPAGPTGLFCVTRGAGCPSLATADLVPLNVHSPGVSGWNTASSFLEALSDPRQGPAL